MNSETPFEGHAPEDSDGAPYEWLDEWLCEYVDGTMDPSLEAVFEQYVEANPELKEHIRRLQQTKDLLCECGLPKEPDSQIEDELCAEVECETPPPSPDAEESSGYDTAPVISSVAVALVVGFLVGATMVRPSTPSAVLSPSLELVSPTYEASSSPGLTPFPPSPRADAPFLSPAPVSSSDTTGNSSTLMQIDLP